jgi:S1-C subfamily serine protease
MSVQAGSPAFRAGLQQGDVILAAAGKATASPIELVAAVEKAGVGGSLTLSVSRAGRQFEITVVPAQLGGSS